MKQQILVTGAISALSLALITCGVDELGALGLILGFFSAFSWIDIANQKKSKI
jgi:hypothetical protein